MLISNFILALSGTIAFVWIMVGSIPGTVLLVLTILEKDKEKKKRYWKWAKICLGGILLLIVVFVLYAIFAMLGAIFGFSITAPLDQIPQ